MSNYINKPVKKNNSKEDKLPPVLKSVIEPFAQYFRRNNVIEICINKPQEIWIETYDGWEFHKDSKLTLNALTRFCEEIATAKGQEFGRKSPLLSTQIPVYGYRLQAVGSGVTEFSIALSIRVGASQTFPLESYLPSKESIKKGENKDLFEPVNDADFLRHIMRTGKNLLVSGGTNSGKTSLYNSLINEIPAGQRIVIIEDTQELVIPHANYVRLLISKSGTGVAPITYKDLINVTMRLRPDRILLGEIDVENAFPFLRLAASGHSGCMASLHANDADSALDTLVKNSKLAGVQADATEIRGYAHSALDLLVQVNKVTNTNREFDIQFYTDKKTLLEL